MKIEHHSPTPSSSHTQFTLKKPEQPFAKKVWLRRVCFNLYLMVMFAILFGCGMFFRPLLFYTGQNYYIVEHALSPATDFRKWGGAFLSAPFHYANAWISAPKMDELAVDIKFEHLNQIHQKREEALKTGVLIASGDDEVPAVIHENGRPVKVKMRLKGDWTDHLRGNKWSFRVHVKDDEGQLLGMRHFSLQAPQTRGYQGELLFLEHARKLGILAPRYQFAKVRVNGRDLGIMAVEEHFAPELPTAQKRPESVILRLDESDVWNQIGRDRNERSIYKNFRTAPIKPFLSSWIEQSPRRIQDLKIARGLLRAFLTEDLPASQVFDTQLMGRYLALTEVWDTTHGMDWINWRFYYNPTTAKLEPVSYDTEVQKRSFSVGLSLPESTPFPAFLLKDPEIRKQYVRALGEIAKDITEGEILTHLKQLEAETLLMLHQEFPLLQPYDFEPIKARARMLLAVNQDNYESYRHYAFPNEETEFARLLYAYAVQPEHADPYLELVNPLDEPVEVTAIFWDAAGQTVPQFQAKQGLTLPLTVPPTPYGAKPHLIKIPFQPVPGAVLKVATQLKKRGQKQTVDAIPYDPPLLKQPRPSVAAEKLSQGTP